MKGVILIALVGSATAAASIVAEATSSLLTESSQGLQVGWTNVTKTTRPTSLAGAMMAYSVKDDRIVLFGGWDGHRGLNETWVLDPDNATWTQLHPTQSPIERGDHMFEYDEGSDVFVLFGGWYEFPDETYIRLSDTWTFSMRTGEWTEQNPDVSPSPRSDSQSAYNPTVGSILVFGGFDGTGYLGDAWTYSVPENTWTPRPAPVLPSARADGRMVYVPQQDRFILFGGNDYHGPNFTFHHFSDTWSYQWDSNSWTHIATLDRPSARDYPILVTDPANARILLTSGYGERIILNDLWAFSITSDSWSEITPTSSPPPRFAAAGGFDSEDNVLVLFGGLGTDGLLSDTWYYWDESHDANPSGILPSLVVVLGIAAVVIAVPVSVVLLRKRPKKACNKPNLETPSSSVARHSKS